MKKLGCTNKVLTLHQNEAHSSLKGQAVAKLWGEPIKGALKNEVMG